MKYLQNYQDEAQTKLFDKTGGFFAFSTKQFNEQKKESIKYVSLGAGLICPDDNAKELIENLDIIYRNSINQDLKENGKEEIIKRELYNHECFYTGDISGCVEKIKDYGITEKEILTVYNKESREI